MCGVISLVAGADKKGLKGLKILYTNRQECASFRHLWFFAML